MSRIVLYAHYLPPEPSACSTRMASLARHLKSRGYHPLLLTSRACDQVCAEFDVVRVSGRFGLFQWLWRHKPCPILVSSPPGTPASEVALWAKLLGYRLVVDVRDPFVAEALKLGEIRPGWRAWVKGHLERMLLRSTPRVSFVSESLRAAMGELLGMTFPKAVIAPNGADSDVFPGAENTRAETRLRLGIGDAPVFVYQGILGGKELDKVFLALFSILSHQTAHVVVVAVVDEHSAALYTQLREMVANAGFEDRFHWLENLKGEQLAEILNASDIGLNPLPNHRVYCLPVKTFEYMACGVLNLAIANADSPLCGVLNDPRLGRVVTDWEGFRLAAEAAAADVQRSRVFAGYRVQIAHQLFSRQAANEVLEGQLVNDWK